MKMLTVFLFSLFFSCSIAFEPGLIYQYPENIQVCQIIIGSDNEESIFNSGKFSKTIATLKKILENLERIWPGQVASPDLKTIRAIQTFLSLNDRNIKIQYPVAKVFDISLNIAKFFGNLPENSTDLSTARLLRLRLLRFAYNNDSALEFQNELRNQSKLFDNDEISISCAGNSSQEAEDFNWPNGIEAEIKFYLDKKPKVEQLNTGKDLADFIVLKAIPKLRQSPFSLAPNAIQSGILEWWNFCTFIVCSEEVDHQAKQMRRWLKSSASRHYSCDFKWDENGSLEGIRLKMALKDIRSRMDVDAFLEWMKEQVMQQFEMATKGIGMEVKLNLDFLEIPDIC